MSEKLKTNLICKRDNLFPLVGGGNKARKSHYILAKASENGYSAIVTTSSSQSNHLRATALFAEQLEWKTVLVVHDSKSNTHYCGNLKLTNLTGSELRFVQKEVVAEAMDKAIDDLEKEGFKPL